MNPLIQNILKDIPAIKSFANNTILELIIKYNEQHTPNGLMLWISNHSKALIVVFCSINNHRCISRLRH